MREEEEVFKKGPGKRATQLSLACGTWSEKTTKHDIVSEWHLKITCSDCLGAFENAISLRW